MEWISQSYSIFIKGGPVMYLMFFCSAAVIAIALERYGYYKRTVLSGQEFRSRLQAALQSRQSGEAIELCRRYDNCFAKIALQGLLASQQNRNMETALEGAAALVAARLRENLNYLSTVVTLAPLLGLLGTVIGMINSFSVFHLKNGQPLAITGGVGEALIATATGLSVAVMALLTHTYYSHRLEKHVTEMEEMCNVLLNSCPGAAVIRGKNHEIA